MVKARGKEVDAALKDLLNANLISKFKTGKFWCYYATTEGQEMAESMD